MTIHSDHPFADPHREDGRRLRGRLGSRVSLWTSGDLTKPPHATHGAAGLTVTSMLAVAGDPWRVVALLDPDAELTERLLETAVAGIQLLSRPHRPLAEAFAGLSPAPGGPFRLASFTQTSHGPRLHNASTWVATELESHRELGWSLEVVCRIVESHLGDDSAPLHHVRGRLTVGVPIDQA